MIRHKILSFIHEKIFRHDKGTTPNKFTNLIYAILMPIQYIINHNTSLRYDWNRDIYFIGKMAFTGKLLRNISNANIVDASQVNPASIFQSERDLLWSNYANLIGGSLKGANIIKIPALNIEMKLIDEPKDEK